MTLKITREAFIDGTMQAHMQKIAAEQPDMTWRTEAEMAALLDKTLAAHDPKADIHVFGYGSLIWNPAFHYVESQPALLHGLHRRFCLKMLSGRGTREKPGLMLALDLGGACKGVVFRIAAQAAREELEILWRREMYGGAYNARWITARTATGPVRAITFVINRKHPRYMPELSVPEMAAIIATACGEIGSCREYLENTVKHLGALGLRDSGLERIVAALPKP